MVANQRAISVRLGSPAGLLHGLAGGAPPERAALIRLTRGASLVAPPSVHWEIGNALTAMFKRKTIEPDQALELLDACAAIPIRLLDVALVQAVELAARLKIYACDACVIACALNQRAPILTLDGGLAARARELALEVPEMSIP